jgi:hypothetical protein
MGASRHGRNLPTLAHLVAPLQIVFCGWLDSDGFRVTRGMAGLPSAFVAEFGNGRPAVGFLAEYDALPGLSNAAEADRRPLLRGAARAHMVPAANLPAALVWQANGSEVDTVLVDGEVVVRHGRPSYLTAKEEQALYADASARAAAITQRARIAATRPWRQIGR